MANKNVTHSKNYIQIVPNDFINLFLDLYSHENSIERNPAIMLWGQPGVGKSQAVKEAAQLLAKKLHRKAKVTVASLLLMNPIDLRGIPAKAENDAGEIVARWLTPEIFKMDDSDDVLNVLFLDEISAAPPSVQAAAYQICLDKRVGEHQLPKNCIVIAAGNRITDKAVAYKMPKPLGNRLTHFEMVASVEDWKKWAYKNDIDTRIIGFINHDHDYLCRFDPSVEDVAFATPRSWEMVSYYLSIGDVDTYFSCIAGTVGVATAQEFKTYTEVYDSLPSFDNIASGKEKKCPKDIVSQPDVMFALSTLIASRCSELGRKVDFTNVASKEKFNNIISNVCKYISTISRAEYKTLIFRDWLHSSTADVVDFVMSNDEAMNLTDDIADMIA